MKKYITTKKDLKEFLKYESQKYGMKSTRCPRFCIRENAILYKFNYLLRKTEYYTNTNNILKIWYKFRLAKYKVKYMLSIPLNVFDKGLYLVHIGPRLVNGRAVVGKDCVMHINTCIVAGGTNDFVPELGNHIILGVSAIVSGQVVLGDNIAVGANSFVNKSFPDGNVTIAGSPAKVVSSHSSNDWNKTKHQKK